AIVENDLSHALRTGLYDVTFIKRQAIVRTGPTVAIGLPDANRSVQGSEVRLLSAAQCVFVGGGSSTCDAFQYVSRQLVGCFDRGIGELREGKAHACPEDQQNAKQNQRYAAIGNRLPRDVNARLAL